MERPTYLKTGLSSKQLIETIGDDLKIGCERSGEHFKAYIEGQNYVFEVGEDKIAINENNPLEIKIKTPLLPLKT